MVDLTLLTAPACPHAEVFDRRLAPPRPAARMRWCAAARSPMGNRPPGPAQVHCLTASRGAAPRLPPAVPSLAGCFVSGVFAVRVTAARGWQLPR
jgi:hypothetical protein